MYDAIASGVKFTESDVVEIDNWIPAGEYNPHNVRPWLLHDHGFVLAVVFASNLQDAIDEAVDADKLDRFMIDESDLPDYVDGDGHESGISYLGNAGEPFDIESLQFIQLQNPKQSFTQQYASQFTA